jgi:NNP family nitrate/nitrite transporter-like MFS transporter
VAVYFTTFGGFMALTGWLPQYWQTLHGLRLGQAGLLTALFSMLASLLRVAGGALADRFGGERTAAASLLLLAAGAALVSFSPSLASAVAGIVVMAVGMGVGNAAVFKLVPALVPQAVGGASGWIGGLGAFGGFVIPILLAAIAGRWATGYARGFLIFVALAAGALAVVAALHRAAARTVHKEAATWQKN